MITQDRQKQLNIELLTKLDSLHQTHIKKHSVRGLSEARDYLQARARCVHNGSDQLLQRQREYRKGFDAGFKWAIHSLVRLDAKEERGEQNEVVDNTATATT